MVDNPQMIESALDYARRGIPLFPLHDPTSKGCSCGKTNCNSVGKHPRTARGLKDATTDEQQIKEWWEKWPNANIGIPTGKASGVFALDVDPRHGGDESLRELERRYGFLPTTTTVSTGGGGRHLIYKQPRNITIKNATNLDGLPGLDLRGDGGYIVAPPSLHASGKRYVLDENSSLEPVAPPDWLISCSTDRHGATRNQTRRQSVAATLDGVPEGQRNDRIFELVCQYYRGGIPEAVTEELALKAAENCTPPYPRSEVQDMVARIYQEGASSSRHSAPWPDPDPIQSELPPVMAFGEELLPISFRAAARDIAERMQVSLDYPAIAQISTLAGAVNRRAEIQPKTKDDTWLVKPNLWGGIIAPPGFMKTPTLESATRLLRKIEDEYRSKFEQESLDFQVAKELWDLQKNAYRQSATQAYKKNQALPQEVAPAPEEPKQLRLIINDATFESLHEIMAVNPAGIFLVRDELSGFLAQLDRPGREGERAFYLQAWNGDTGHTIDRIGRGSIHVAACCVSMLGGIQPNKLKAYFADTLRGGPTDDGLIQRFQLLVWPDPPNTWKLVDRPPDSMALKQVETILQKLVKLDAEFPLRFKFSAEAQELFYAWLAALEAKVRSEDIHPALAGHLSKFRKTMPALALLFELADRAADPCFDGFVASLQGDFEIFGEVSLRHAQQAAAFCDYLESHARRVYACVITPQVRAAHVLASKIKTKKVGAEGVFSLREVYLKGWSGLDSPELAQGAAGILQDADWIRPANGSPGAQGGRPSIRYEINPKVWE